MTDLFHILLLEVVTKPKTPYSSGSEHTIYPNNHDSTKLFKVVTNDPIRGLKDNWIEIFKKYPKYFPTIYRSNDKGAEVEKLDTNKSDKEFDVFYDDTETEFYDLLDLIVSKKNYKPLLKYCTNIITQLSPEMIPAFKRWIKLAKGISSIPMNLRPDIHKNNFGYDKKGNLKMIDI